MMDLLKKLSRVFGSWGKNKNTGPVPAASQPHIGPMGPQTVPAVAADHHAYTSPGSTSSGSARRHKKWHRQNRRDALRRMRGLSPMARTA